MFRGKFLAGSCGRLFFIAFLVVFSGAVFATGTYDGGDGTEGNPFQIRTAEQLIELSQHSEDWGKGFILTDDIDMDPNLLGEGVVMSPIGNSTIPFLGVFDGGGHVISNLTINLPDTDNVGLFGKVYSLDFSSVAEIKNLGVKDVSITGKNFVGGLVGYCEGSISQCYSKGVVNGVQRTGGLVGEFAGEYFRGIRGISDCYSSAEVNCSGSIAGGLIGISSYYAEVSRCYSTGAVNGPNQEFSGGFTFIREGLMGSGCFWDAETSGISAGPINGYSMPFGSDIVGLETAFMKNPRFYSYRGWSGDVWTIDEGKDYPRLAWEDKPGLPIPESDGFKGSGTAGDPYKIESAADLRILSFDDSLWDKHFILTADLDLNGIFMPPIGILIHKDIGGGVPAELKFSGSFDGNGHVISNLKIDLPDYNFVGLFASTHTSSEIKNLGLRDVDINGYKNVGGLVGSNSGNISQCFVTGSVSGVENVGGFAGSNGDYGFDLYGVIDDCYSICSVTGEEVVGGLIGRMSGGTVNRSYSASIVNGNLYSGGFAGLRSMAGTCSYCFWDIALNTELSDMANGDFPEIYGLTTELMKTAASFTGWDFDGDDNVWRLCVDGSGYPRLAWEYYKHGDFVCPDGVDLLDFSYFAKRFKSDTDIQRADLDGDGLVEVSDLAILSSHWLE